MSEDGPSTPRRASRVRSKPRKYGDFFDLSLTKRKHEEEVESSEDDDNEVQCLQKPTALFSNDDVEGQDIFKFKSRHTKLDLQNKVKATISSSPKVIESPMKTPRKSILKGINSPFMKLTEVTTPKHFKDVMKKRILKEIESDSEETDFSGDSSDFVPEESEESGSSPESEEDDREEEQKEEKIKKPSKVQIVKNKDTKMKHRDPDYIITPDNYFMMHSSKKITTSDHTLARLKNINITNRLLDTDSYISQEHKKNISDLSNSYEHLFNKWLYVLSENYNIILYGIGSKRPLLHQFQMLKLQDFPCIVVNGFFPSLTVKSVLETIVIDLLGNSTVPSNISDVVSLIENQLKEKGMELFLIIHNIDGTMLRNAKTQSTLASIAQIKNIRTIATIDHINAPLLWDHSKLSKFNFTWWDVTTFQPYTEETAFENSLMTQRSGALQLSSLRSVFASLTTNAKGIYNIIIQHQLENHKQSHYQESNVVINDYEIFKYLKSYLMEILIFNYCTCSVSKRDSSKRLSNYPFEKFLKDVTVFIHVFLLP
ncbi:origin recognition complex subunit 2 isoform X2 [Hyposmocoma kahamanoa]|uniref:origin recognition complex subunit 2 isoform X2 n=1 Tax=Hyposmocoma kahamanoa TaxID=1477025 RepID=UPI000E6D966E|nr:origin recognition complex subunit 2 isoform X2 [Hyposmocoma kahamanoa]